MLGAPDGHRVGDADGTDRNRLHPPGCHGDPLALVEHLERRCPRPCELEFQITHRELQLAHPPPRPGLSQQRPGRCAFLGLQLQKVVRGEPRLGHMQVSGGTAPHTNGTLHFTGHPHLPRLPVPQIHHRGRGGGGVHLVNQPRDPAIPVVAMHHITDLEIGMLGQQPSRPLQEDLLKPLGVPRRRGCNWSSVGGQLSLPSRQSSQPVSRGFACKDGAVALFPEAHRNNWGKRRRQGHDSLLLRCRGQSDLAKLLKKRWRELGRRPRLPQNLPSRKGFVPEALRKTGGLLLEPGLHFVVGGQGPELCPDGLRGLIVVKSHWRW
mmetsp:Transcript_103380/g.236911  ORF Transcript_103380/g.236911 Transcript_103380/m.236911 type:complete len:322 (+) Transcript_103380:899-1864(+)